MSLKIFYPAFLAGYLIAVLLVYIVFDYFSWGFVIGSILGVTLFAFIIAVLKKRRK